MLNNIMKYAAFFRGINVGGKNKVKKNLYSAYNGNDKLHRGERELYLLCYQSVRNSKLAGQLAKLDTPLTARNQKTLCKIYELLSDGGAYDFN